MKILHTSDLHFDKKMYEKIAKIQKNYDLIVISGDLIDATKDNIKNQINWLIDWSNSIKIPILISSGNHDFDYKEAKWMQKLNAICDSKIEIDNLKIIALPYIGGDFSECFNADILVYHIPPLNTLTSTTKDYKDFGDIEIKEYLKFNSPKYLLCGHIHNPLKREDRLNKTTIINSALTFKTIDFRN
jgi:Icc-related predicted phosphoesterase